MNIECIVIDFKLHDAPIQPREAQLNVELGIGVAPFLKVIDPAYLSEDL